MIAIYAITDVPPASLPQDPPLIAVHSRGLVAVCGPPPERPITVDLLWRHENVVEALMKTCNLLPVRFGMQVKDENAAAGVLRRQHGELVAALDRVRGAVELSIRIAAGDDAPRVPVPAGSGAEYMRAKARKAATEELLATRIHEPLARLARLSRRSESVRADEPLRAAYLVDRASIAPFTDRVSGLQQENPDVRILCTGPWPPYSFVS